MNDRKVFDEFPTVDCNECERWWLDQCDGVKATEKGSKRACSTFIATRQLIIPKQIESLQKRVKLLGWALILLGVAHLIHLIGEIVNVFL